MIELRHILCPIDFSDLSRHAFVHAVALARRYGATLTLLHVRPLTPALAYTPGIPGPAAGSVSAADDHEALRASLKRIADAHSGAGVAMHFDIADGDAVAGILDRAVSLPSDLLVLGTHGRSGFERLMLGSVTERVIHKARCPVLTVPRPAADVETPVPLARMLCAIDFSDASLRALDYALSLARPDHTHLTLVHVVEVTPAPKSLPDAGAEDRALGAYVAAAAQARAEQLQGLVAARVTGQLRVDTMVAIGNAHREILRIAAERGIDLIVLGAHGFGVSQLLFGSAAHQVVRQAHCPVLTVR